MFHECSLLTEVLVVCYTVPWCVCRKRATAESSLSHEWLLTKQKEIKKIGTKRLKSFRARRRWLVSGCRALSQDAQCVDNQLPDLGLLPSSNMRVSGRGRRGGWGSLT